MGEAGSQWRDMKTKQVQLFGASDRRPKFPRIQSEAVLVALAVSGKTSRISPAGLHPAATSATLAMARDGELGIRAVHEDVRSLVIQFLTEVQQHRD